MILIVRRTWGRSISAIAALFVICYLTLHSSRDNSSNAQVALKTFSLLCEKTNQREALYDSPFSEYTDKHNWFSSHQSDWQEFRSQTLSEQCSRYFQATYAKNPDWTNDDLRLFWGVDARDDAKLSNIVERVRVFDDCFIKSDLTLNQVLPESINISDFHHRMFPFLKVAEDATDLWPTITHLNSGQVVARGVRPHYSKDDDVPFSADNSKSFWQNWNSFSKGKGLVFSLGERHLDPFLRLLKILDQQNNSLPIQIVQQPHELSDAFLGNLTEFLQSSHQEVYYIDCGALLDTTYKAYMTYFVNKWLASIFNTFSEVVLMDADVVPFVPVESFFQEEQYKATGVLLYKDRDMPQETTFDYCITTFKLLEPSSQEVVLMNHRMKTNSTVVDPGAHIFANEKDKVYHRFFYNKTLHNVDSGLVVLHKTERLSGLLISFIMNLDQKASKCIYGDKELFWLGQLFSGNDYAIDPLDGAAVGRVNLTHDNVSGHQKYEICATQMGHGSSDGRLLWTNGGLKACKIKGAAHIDFERIPEHFEQHFGTEEKLQALYDLPLSIEGYIIPNISRNAWLKGQDCLEYSYCASLLVEDQKEPPLGTVVVFDDDYSQQLNELSKIWNQDIKL